MGTATKRYSAGYSEEDVTNVYSAILSTKPKAIANGLFSIGEYCLPGKTEFMGKRKDIAESRIFSIMNLIKQLQPNFEKSAECPIKPWDTSSIKSVRGKSWPNVLGMRIVMPKSASENLKACYVSNLLTAMAHIQ